MEATRPLVKRRLYEIADDLYEVLAVLDEQDGEINDAELSEAIDALPEEFDTKAVQCALVGRSAELQRDMVKAEVERLLGIVDRYERKRQWIRNYLHTQMSRLGIRKIDRDPRMTVYIQRSRKSVEYLGGYGDGLQHCKNGDEQAELDWGEIPTDVPLRFVRGRIEWKLDKQAILEAAEKGEELPDSVKVRQNTHVRWR